MQKKPLLTGDERIKEKTGKIRTGLFGLNI